MMKPTSAAVHRMPPTTPPAIAPAFESFFPELPTVEELGPDDVADGVPSGSSFNIERKKKRS